ncbi:hypothetical protein GGI42DRAFT_243660 [Trichoderma sp. SZMC 28013]
MRRRAMRWQALGACSLFLLWTGVLVTQWGREDPAEHWLWLSHSPLRRGGGGGGGGLMPVPTSAMIQSISNPLQKARTGDPTVADTRWCAGAEGLGEQGPNVTPPGLGRFAACEALHRPVAFTP